MTVVDKTIAFTELPVAGDEGGTSGVGGVDKTKGVELAVQRVFVCFEYDGRVGSE